MSESGGLISPEQGEITEISMKFNDSISFDDWEAIGGQLHSIQKGLMFWVGDWLNFGEKKFGESYAQAINKTGYDYKTVKQAKYIAGKFAPERRSDDLTFSHYSVVAGEEPERADELLAIALDKDMTVSELRAERKGEPVQNPTKTVSQGAVMATCPSCQNHFEVPLD